MKISTLVALASLAAAVVLGGLGLALGGVSPSCHAEERPRGDGGTYTANICDASLTGGKVFMGLAGLCLLIAFLAGFAALVTSLVRPMERALSQPLAHGAAATARAASAAREKAAQASAARAERQAQQAQGAGGYGTGYRDDVIDAEVVDFPYESDEYPATGHTAPQPEAPREEPMSKPTAGWGSSFTFEEES